MKTGNVTFVEKPGGWGSDYRYLLADTITRRGDWGSSPKRRGVSQHDYRLNPYFRFPSMVAQA